MFEDWFKKILHKEGEEGGKKSLLQEIGLSKLLILLACGVVLLFLTLPEYMPDNKKTNASAPLSNSNNSTKSETNQTTEEYTKELENKLKQVLCKVGNIGNVEVMITVKSSKELVPLKDKPYDEETTKEQDTEGGTRNSERVNQQEETVLITTEEGETIPYIVKEIQPEVEGVLVIAEGADQSAVQSEIVDAVMVLFDVPTHKIKVMKMKK